MIRHIRPVHHRPLSNTTCFAVALTLLALTVGCGDDSAATDAAGQGANGQGANGQGANGQGANGQGGEGAAGGADVTFEDVTVQVTKVEYASFDGFGNVLGHGVNGDLLEPGCATFSEPVQFTDVGSSVGGVGWMEDDEEGLVVGVPAGEQADQLAAIQTEFAGGDSVQRSRDYLYVGYRPWGFDTADGVKANDSPDCGDEVVNLIHPKRAFAFVIREVYPSPEVSESFSTPAY